MVAVVALVLSNGNGRSGSAHSSVSITGKLARVTIQNYAFHPQSLTVRVGTRVTWVNLDGTAHTATADQGSFDTGTLNTGQSRTIVFMRQGSYPYHCLFHAFMTGTVKVVGR